MDQKEPTDKVKEEIATKFNKEQKRRSKIGKFAGKGIVTGILGYMVGRFA